MTEYESHPKESHAAQMAREARENGTSLNFGEALQALKVGRKVARYGWNGKGMYLYLLIDGTGHFEPCIVMFTAQKTHQPGWLASQADILANDWALVIDGTPE